MPETTLNYLEILYLLFFGVVFVASLFQIVVSIRKLMGLSKLTRDESFDSKKNECLNSLSSTPPVTFLWKDEQKIDNWYSRIFPETPTQSQTTYGGEVGPNVGNVRAERTTTVSHEPTTMDEKLTEIQDDGVKKGEILLGLEDNTPDAMEQEFCKIVERVRQKLIENGENVEFVEFLREYHYTRQWVDNQIRILERSQKKWILMKGQWKIKASKWIYNHPINDYLPDNELLFIISEPQPNNLNLSHTSSIGEEVKLCILGEVSKFNKGDDTWELLIDPVAIYVTE